MIYKNVELHNVEAVQERGNDGGVLLCRFPLDVIDTKKGRAAVVARSAVGCEIRFVTTATTVWVTMEPLINNAKITVYLGDFIFKRITLEAGKKTTFELRSYECFNNNVDPEFFNTFEQRFPVKLWRISVNIGDTYCVLHNVEGIDGIVRPPHDDEIGLKKWMAYGSSITHGWYSANDASYVQHAAKLLNVDLLCKGMSESCMCEKDMANYIANAQWDFLTMELGVNMYGFKTKEFKKRVRYLIEVVHESKPDNKVFVITPFPNYCSFGKDKDYSDKHADYVNILNETVSEIHSDNVQIISGDDIMTTPAYLSGDLIHPSEFGQIEMGENLYRILKERL